MTQTWRARLADRRMRSLTLAVAVMLLLLIVIGILLYVRVNSVLDRYMEVQGEKQAETLAELTHRQFQLELTALYTVASELPHIGDMRGAALRAIRDADSGGRIGVQCIDGSAFFGEAYSFEDFPCIESAVHGENAMSYCPGKGLMFCVPAMREGNIVYVVYRLYPEESLYDRFGVTGYGGSGRTRIEDAEGRVVVCARPVGETERDIFDEETVQSGVRILEQTLYETGSASVFRRSSLGEVMLYAAVIENSDYHVAGCVPKTVVMEGVQYISSMVILVFSVLSGMVFLGGYLLIGLERKSRETDALREAAKVAEKSSAVKSAFLANMSHDIRTPMNAIIGFTNLALQDPGDTAKTREYLGKIRTSSVNLLSLINGILEMSRLESGLLELNETSFSLAGVLSDLETVMAGPAEEKHQELTMDMSSVTDPFVYCDRPRLHQVLLNLLGNAVKFTPEGGKISLRILQGPGSVPGHARYELRVKDNGVGMSPEFAAKAFSLFEREQTSTVSGVQGSGLGLPIVRNIVDSMGGSIRLETAQGVGSEFIVDLELRLAGDRELPEERGAAGETEASLEGLRILLVDDIGLNREIAAMVLEMNGFEVEQACDGSEAVEKIASAAPGYFDAVLMDIQMPVMNGYEATRAIRKMEGPRGSIPILALSANAFDEDKHLSAEAGMDDHLAKPLDEALLLEALRGALKKRRGGPRS